MATITGGHISVPCLMTNEESERTISDWMFTRFVTSVGVPVGAWLASANGGMIFPHDRVIYSSGSHWKKGAEMGFREELKAFRV